MDTTVVVNSMALDNRMLVSARALSFSLPLPLPLSLSHTHTQYNSVYYP